MNEEKHWIVTLGVDSFGFFAHEKMAEWCNDFGNGEENICTVGTLDCPFRKKCILVTSKDWKAVLKEKTI